MAMFKGSYLFQPIAVLVMTSYPCYVGGTRISETIKYQLHVNLHNASYEF